MSACQISAKGAINRSGCADQTIEQGARSVVLDHEMDAGPQRCVITLAGEPDAVAEAAILGTGKAMELIDRMSTRGLTRALGRQT